MMSWINTIRNVFETKELRTRLYNTFFYAIIFRLGTFIILPGIDPTLVKANTSGFLALLDTLLNSSSLRTSSIFSLGIAPYISASIITQITSLTIPYFQRLKKEGPAGREQLNQFTRYLTLAMAPLQCSTYMLYLVNNPASSRMILLPKLYFLPLSILILTSGTMFCVWLADRISSKGIGSGSSVLISVGILSGLPGALYMEYDNTSLFFFMIELLLLLAIITITTAFMQGVRKIPLQYASQMIHAQANYRTSGVPQFLPIGLNSAGVMPIIFAQTLIAMPLIGAKLLAKKSTKAAAIVAVLQDQYSWQYNVILGTLIFMGTFFYAAIFVNAVEMADELKRSNGFIPGIKSGKSTAEYIDAVLSKITFPGSLFLVLVAIMPLGAFKFIQTTKEMSRFFGGTSLLILIGVILDIVQRIQSHLFSNYYSQYLEAPHSTLSND